MLTQRDLYELREQGRDAVEEIAEARKHWWRGILHQASRLKAQTGVEVELVDATAAARDADDIFAYIKRTGKYPYPQDDYDRISGNLMLVSWRIAHDLCHYTVDSQLTKIGMRADFSLSGETRTYYHQVHELLRHSPDLSDHMRLLFVQMMFSDIVLRVATIYETGDSNPEAKTVLLDAETINQWLAQHGLRPVTLRPMDLGAAREYIWAIDFGRTRHAMTRPIKYALPADPAWVDRAIERYRKFLWLHVKYLGEHFSPPIDIDEVWHSHILDTDAYGRDCAALFSRPLRHLASISTQEQADLAPAQKRLHYLFALEFGEHLDTTDLPRWV